jgi:1,4-alpha-glucan branching enzyme
MTAPFITDYDLHLLSEGRHYRSYEKLGGHVCEEDGANGVHFAVTAPNADRVSVIGDFNGWDPDTHLLHPRSDSGI